MPNKIWVQFLTVTHSGKHVLVELLIIIVIFFSLMCLFDSVVSSDVKVVWLLVVECFAPVFWCHVEYKIVLNCFIINPCGTYLQFES